MKDAGAAGAGTAWTAGGQGQGSRPQAVSVTGTTGSLGTRRCYLQCTGPPKARLSCACGRRACDEAAGTRVPRVPASAGYGNGAALQITALVSGTGSILHDQPRTKRSRFCARGVRLRVLCLGLAPVRWLLQRTGASVPGRQSARFRHEVKRRVPKGGAESSQSGGLGFVSWVAGPRCSHFWPVVRSGGPWLGGWRGKPSGPARSTDGQRCD